MRKLLFLTLATVALLCLCVVPNTEASDGWSSSVSPTFAFNGDNITLKVTGIPGHFAFVKIMLGNNTIDDSLIFLDDMGRGSVNWSVPILAETGTYRFVVVSQGMNVTEAKLSVIFDDVTYLRWRVDNVEKENDQLKLMVKKAGAGVEDVQSRLVWIWGASTIGICGFVGFAMITIMFYVPALKQKMEDYVRMDGLRGKVGRFHKTFFDPDIDGWRNIAQPTLDVEAERHRIITPNDMRCSSTLVALDDGISVNITKKKGRRFMNLKRIINRSKHLERGKTPPPAPIANDVNVVVTEEKTPDRVEAPPHIPSEVGTSPDKPSPVVPDDVGEKVPETVEDVPKPRKKASTKTKGTKRRSAGKNGGVVPKTEVIQ